MHKIKLIPKVKWLRGGGITSKVYKGQDNVDAPDNTEYKSKRTIRRERKDNLNSAILDYKNAIAGAYSMDEINNVYNHILENRSNYSNREFNKIMAGVLPLLQQVISTRRLRNGLELPQFQFPSTEDFGITITNPMTDFLTKTYQNLPETNWDAIKPDEPPVIPVTTPATSKLDKPPVIPVTTPATSKLDKPPVIPVTTPATSKLDLFYYVYKDPFGNTVVLDKNTTLVDMVGNTYTLDPIETQYPDVSVDLKYVLFKKKLGTGDIDWVWLSPSQIRALTSKENAKLYEHYPDINGYEAVDFGLQPPSWGGSFPGYYYYRLKDPNNKNPKQFFNPYTLHWFSDPDELVLDMQNYLNANLTDIRINSQHLLQGLLK